MSTEEIYNYVNVNHLVSTGGQPTEDQLRAAASEGFTAVINLATYNPRYSLDDEEGLIASLGLAYYFLPVDWENPKVEDFLRFERVLKALQTQKTLIHCAANYRATAFYALYAIKHLGWSNTQAESFRNQIWRDSRYPIWEKFIGMMKAKIAKEAQESKKESPVRQGRSSPS